MSFGFGVDDVVAISGLVRNIYMADKDAHPHDCRNISDEVKSLQILIDKAAPYFESTTLESNSRQEGQRALMGCKDVLEDLTSVIEKYNSSGSSTTTQDIATLKKRLISNTCLLNAFIQRSVPTIPIEYIILISPSCESREIREVEERLAGVLGLHHTTSRSSTTSFAGSETAYKQFCKNLFQMGVTPEMITQSEGEIRHIFNAPQDAAIGDEGNDGGNIADQSQVLGVCYSLNSWCFICSYVYRYTKVNLATTT